MIILYNENETQFSTLGLGVLKDAVSCFVEEHLNGSFELEMQYPVDGAHYNDISLRKIIFVKPNVYDNPQAFRIYSISKPIEGVVTINAEHLSYDLSGYVVDPFDAPVQGIQAAFTAINSKVVGSFPFIFETDITNTDSDFNVQVPSTVRSLLAGQDGSLLDTFKGEYKFNNYRVILNQHRGKDRGYSVRYGKNLTEVTQELKSNKLYTDIYPYFYRIVTNTETSTSYVYQQAYVRSSTQEETVIPFTKDWLSLTSGGAAFIPLIKNTPVQIATEGEYYQKIYIWADVVNPTTGEPETKYVEVTAEQYPANLPTTTSTQTQTTELVTLTNKTIPIPGRESVSPKRILNLDLTQSFSEKPTEEELTTKANEYITNNKVGQIVETVEASFVRIDNSSINEAEIHLGDYVNVIFTKLGISSKLQVITTTFNVLNNEYDEIELGEKKSTLSDNSLSIGDNVSSLANDAGYTDEIKVANLIAKNITADYILATNVNFTEAQITRLTTDELLTAKIIQASEAAIDTLVAELLVADNAAIRKQLTVGENLIVNGEININNGTIAITDDRIIINGQVVEPTIAYINQNGTIYTSNWLKASYDSTEALTPDASKVYKVFDIYNVWTQEYYTFNTTENRYEIFFPETTTYFRVDESGNIFANSATIAGHIDAKSGRIGDCEIVGEPDTYIEAYTIAGKQDFARDWLTLTQGSSVPLTPNTTDTYKVYYNNDYHYYKFNGTQYVDMLVGVLQVYSANIQDLTVSVINTVTGLNISIFTNDSDYQTGTEVSDAIEDSWEPYLDQNAKITGTEINAKGISVTATIAGQPETVFGIDANGNVTIRGTVYASAGKIGNCDIDSNGHLQVPSAYITGTLSADKIVGGTITASDIKLGKISQSGTEYNFELDGDTGQLIIRNGDINIKSGSINLGYIGSGQYRFSVDDNGLVESLSAETAIIGGKIGLIYSDNPASGTITSNLSASVLSVIPTLTSTDVIIEITLDNWTTNVVSRTMVNITSFNFSFRYSTPHAHTYSGTISASWDASVTNRYTFRVTIPDSFGSVSSFNYTINPSSVTLPVEDASSSKVLEIVDILNSSSSILRASLVAKTIGVANDPIETGYFTNLGSQSSKIDYAYIEEARIDSIGTSASYIPESYLQQLTVSTSINPASNNVVTLGNDSYRFKELHVNNLYLEGENYGQSTTRYPVMCKLLPETTTQTYGIIAKTQMIQGRTNDNTPYHLQIKLGTVQQVPDIVSITVTKTAGWGGDGSTPTINGDWRDFDVLAGWHDAGGNRYLDLWNMVNYSFPVSWLVIYRE